MKPSNTGGADKDKRFLLTVAGQNRDLLYGVDVGITVMDDDDRPSRSETFQQLAQSLPLGTWRFISFRDLPTLIGGTGLQADCCSWFDNCRNQGLALLTPPI